MKFHIARPSGHVVAFIIIDLNGGDFCLDFLTGAHPRGDFLIHNMRQNGWFTIRRICRVQSLNVGNLDPVIAILLQPFGHHIGL